MSLTSDDARQSREFHSPRLGPETRNHRDASRGAAVPWNNPPTVIPTPGRMGASSARLKERLSFPQGRGQNPWGKDRMASNNSKAAISSSSQHASKRQKIEHQNTPSKFFGLPQSERRTRSKPAPSPPLAHITDAIVIEDDTPDLNDSSSKPDTLTTSSPDPMDIIERDDAYSFDSSKPSPLHQLSSSLEKTHRSSTDGESTARLRAMNQDEDRHSPSRIYGASRSAKVPVIPTIETSAQPDGSPRKGKVKQLAYLYEAAHPEQAVPHLDLRKPRKGNMKSKQPPRNVAPLPFKQQDPHATRQSGFFSGSGSSKGKAARKDVLCNLPLEVWSIGVDIPPHEATPEPRANLVWERGLIGVQPVNSSIIFELHIQKGSLGTLQFVDVKKSKSVKPLIQISPLETAQCSTSNGFKLGSMHDDGLLTFKFDSVASDWNEKLYYELVSALTNALVSKDNKSTLDRAGAKAVWEAVTHAHDSRGKLEPSSLNIQPRKVPDSVTKPRPRPKPRTVVAPPADMVVRRSARLSGAEQQSFSPKPDPDEVILTYRSGIGSLNITNGDVSRLNPGEFLNDTLIEFGLKLWLADLHESNPELASQVHVFSSFFYKKLSTKVPEDGYNSVRKWTSRFDLFQKKYIIVPINENMHWYLAIIYFPEYTLLPRPVQTDVSPRRSTRRLGVVIDFPDAKDSDQTPKQVLPPDPPSAQADSVSRSGLLTPDSSRAEDQRDEIDVERMVEGPPLSGPSAKQIDGPSVEAIDEGMDVDVAAGEDDSLTLLYPDPASSPQVQRVELPSSDHQDDVDHPASRSMGEESGVQTPEIPPSTSNEKNDLGRRNSTSPEISIVDDGEPAGIIEEDGPPAPRNLSEGSGIRTPGISPTVFYGKNNHKRRNATSPEVALVDNAAPAEIVVEEDVVMGNPDSEHEETAEHPKTYIFTFDSLSSKHPQAVKRLSKYLLMEAHDKKQLAEETLNEPKGMQAFVPRQDNYCDCGIYLLHFAKTFMKDPKLSSEIIRNRSSPQKSRRSLVPHEHWDKASVGTYRTELNTRISSMSEEWKRQRREQDEATKNQAEAVATAPQEQPSMDPTPAASTKADDSDSEIEVLGSPTKKTPPSKAASRRDSGLAESRKKGTTARTRSG